MKSPSIALEKHGMSAERLFDAICRTVRDRSVRYFSTPPASDDRGSTYFEFEDSLEIPPTWPVQVIFSKSGIVSATLAVDIDPDIGEDFYLKILDQAIYVVLDLLDGDIQRDIASRRIFPE